MTQEDDSGVIKITPSYIASQLLEFYGGDPKRWTQETYSRNEKGVAVDPISEAGDEPVCWCILGGLLATRCTKPWADGNGATADFERAFAAAMSERKGVTYINVVAANDGDSTTFEDVVAVLTEIAGRE